MGLLKRFVDDGLTSGAGVAGRWLLAALGLAAARELAAYFAGHLAVGSATRLIGALQNRLFAHLHGLSLAFHRRHRPADLMERIFYDVERATNLVTGVTATAIETPVRLAGFFAVLWTLHPRMALGIAAVLVPAVLVGRLLGRRLRRAYRALSEELSGLYHSAHESLGAAELLQAYEGGRAAAAEFAGRNGALVSRQTRLHRLHAVQGPVSQGLRLLAVVLACAYGSLEIAAGRLTTGGFAAILVASYAFLQAIDTLVGLYSSAQGGLASAERVLEILDTTTPLVSRPGAAAATFAQDIRLENVRFAYDPSGPRAIDGIDLTLRPGERVALTGPSGSGKTTLVRLLLRLYDPSEGRVLFDGRDARDLDLSSVRALYAVAPQDGVLVDLTIAENIALGRPTASRPEIEAAAVDAGLGPVLSRLPEGLDTRVGRAGAAHSGGERQRVSLARAVLRRAPILLLDEATSALDGTAERDLQVWLGRSGTTSLTIAHRLSTLRGADRVLVLDAGRIVEDGPHDQLLAAGGRYRQLCDNQLL